jgi:hypothetical protein
MRERRRLCAPIALEVVLGGLSWRAVRIVLKRFFVLAALAASGEQAFAQTLDIARTAEGRPDFHGVWESRWRTPLERPPEAEGPIVAADKADALVAAMAASLEATRDLSQDSDFDYLSLMPAPGGFRTSLIVSPENGKRPFTQTAQDWRKTSRELRTKAEDPELLSITERCVSGPGATPLEVVPGGMYRRFVQTPTHTVIHTEEINGVRIIEMAAGARPPGMKSWEGDSTGRWEGDVLVVETRQLRRDFSTLPPAAGGERRVTERFQFNTPDEIGYSYVLHDADMFTEPLRVEFVLVRSDKTMFEASCHEFNYSLPNMMRGARVIEARKPAWKANP